MLELLLVVIYQAATASQITAVRYVIYPFIWINMSIWCVWRLKESQGNDASHSTGTRWGLRFIALLYLLLVNYLPGLFIPHIPGVSLPFQPGMPTSTTILWQMPPGWGPVVTVNAHWFGLRLIPFETTGYLALAYLFYRNLLAWSGFVSSSIMGAFTCVSCTLPLYQGIIAALGAGASTVHMANHYSYDIGTLIFVVSCLLLYRGATKSNQRTVQQG